MDWPTELVVDQTYAVTAMGQDNDGNWSFDLSEITIIDLPVILNPPANTIYYLPLEVDAGGTTPDYLDPANDFSLFDAEIQGITVPLTHFSNSAAVTAAGGAIYKVNPLPAALSSLDTGTVWISFYTDSAMESGNGPGYEIYRAYNDNFSFGLIRTINNTYSLRISGNPDDSRVTGKCRLEPDKWHVLAVSKASGGGSYSAWISGWGEIPLVETDHPVQGLTRYWFNNILHGSGDILRFGSAGLDILHQGVTSVSLSVNELEDWSASSLVPQDTPSIMPPMPITTVPTAGAVNYWPLENDFTDQAGTDHLTPNGAVYFSAEAAAGKFFYQASELSLNCKLENTSAVIAANTGTLLIFKAGNAWFDLRFSETGDPSNEYLEFRMTQAGPDYTVEVNRENLSGSDTGQRDLVVNATAAETGTPPSKLYAFVCDGTKYEFYDPVTRTLQTIPITAGECKHFFGDISPFGHLVLDLDYSQAITSMEITTDIMTLSELNAYYDECLSYNGPHPSEIPDLAPIPTLQADHYWPLEVDGNDAIGPHDLNLSTALEAYGSGFFSAGINGFADSQTLSKFILGSNTGCVIATIGNTLNYSFTYSVAPSDGSLGLEREMFILAGANGSNWEFSIEASGLVFANLTKAFPVGIDADNLPNYPVVIIFKRTPTGFEVYDSLTDTLTAMIPVDPSYPDGFWFEDIESDGDYLCEITAYNFSAVDFINNGIVLSTEITRLDMTLQDCQDRVVATLA